MNVKWLLIFPDNWLSYAPSCLNFVKMLEENNIESLVIYVDDNIYDNSKLEINNFAILVNPMLRKVLLRLRMFNIYKILKLFFASKAVFKNGKYAQLVGFDDCGYLSAYLVDKKAIYYSLEVSRSIFNRFIYFFINVRLLIIQTVERKKYLNDKCENVVYIQNAPIISHKNHQAKDYKGRLIYFGNANQQQGVVLCIEALQVISDATLVVKGLKASNGEYINYLTARYKHLIETNRLRFDFSYIKQEDVGSYLQNFDIGFSFFDFDLVNDNNYNYLSSPSGKVFNYFMAGIPVIGNNIIGMGPVKLFNAGLLLDHPNERNISDAVGAIAANYSNFSNNAFRASIEYDFRKMFEIGKEKILGIKGV